MRNLVDLAHTALCSTVRMRQWGGVKKVLEDLKKEGEHLHAFVQNGAVEIDRALADHP